MGQGLYGCCTMCYAAGSVWVVVLCYGAGSVWVLYHLLWGSVCVGGSTMCYGAGTVWVVVPCVMGLGLCGW